MKKSSLDLVASDQNGILDSDIMNVLILPGDRKVTDSGQTNEHFPTKQSAPETSSGTTQPVVVRTNPPDGARGIKISKISAAFSEPMLGSSITTSTFTLKAAGSSTKIPGIVWLANGMDAYFAPLVALDPSTTYVATITAGTKDLAGNSLAAVKKWSFSTGYGNSNTTNAANATSANGSRHPIGREPINRPSPRPLSTESPNSANITNSFQIFDPSKSNALNGTVSQIINQTDPANKKVAGFTTSALDTTPPSVAITSPTNNSPATSNTIKVAGTSADSGSGIKRVMVRIRTATTTTGYTLATPKATNDWSTWSCKFEPFFPVRLGHTHLKVSC